MKIITQKDRRIEGLNATFPIKQYRKNNKLYRRMSLITNFGNWPKRRSSYYAVIEKSSEYWNDGYKISIMKHGLFLKTLHTASYSYAKELAENALLNCDN